MNFETRRHSEKSAWTYEKLDLRQRELAASLDQTQCGTALLSEVAPVITLGRKAVPEDLFYSPEIYQAQGIQIYQTDRGGKATYHGYGQWVLFVIEKLEKITGDPMGVRKATLFLLDIALKVGSRYKKDCHIRLKDETGVWSSEGKFASLGVKISRGVMLHGLCLNGYKTPQSFFGIRPCGLDAPLSFLLDRPDEAGFLQLGHEILEGTAVQLK